MKKKSKGHSNAGKKKPQLSPDEVTRKKIDKHLSDEEDTISEQDIKNINTDLGSTEAISNKTTIPPQNKNDEDDESEKEVPTPWEIIS